jgi:hypothetical protein
LLRDEVLVQGELLKAGEGKQSEKFLRRYVKLTNTCLSYHILPESHPIDRINFDDIVGVVCKAPDGNSLEFSFRPIENLGWEKQLAESLDLDATDFVVCTSRVGYHRGRQYRFRTPTVLLREQWLVSIGRILLRYKDRPLKRMSGLKRLRRVVRWVYFRDQSQLLVAALITLNFALNIIEAHFASVEDDSLIAAVFRAADLAFTAVFTVELLVNLFATLVREFVRDVWNWWAPPATRPT